MVCVQVQGVGRQLQLWCLFAVHTLELLHVGQQHHADGQLRLVADLLAQPLGQVDGHLCQSVLLHLF